MISVYEILWIKLISVTIQYFNFLILKLFETNGKKSIKLRIKTTEKNFRWYKKATLRSKNGLKWV